MEWYLKTHWQYPQSLDIQVPCSEKKTSDLMERPTEFASGLSSPCRGTQSPIIYWAQYSYSALEEVEAEFSVALELERFTES